MDHLPDLPLATIVDPLQENWERTCSLRVGVELVPFAEAGPDLGWLKALNVTRNHCAHNARIWNRSTTYPPDRINIRMVEPELQHLLSADTDRIYFLVAVLAHLLRRVDPNSRFPSDFRTLMGKFPVVLGMTPENSMGFVEGWRDEEIWRVSSQP